MESQIAKCAVGMRCRCRDSLAKLLLDSSCAAALLGPKVRQPRRVNSSTTPRARGSSGPTIVRSGRTWLATVTKEPMLFTSTGKHSDSSAMPPLPGAQYTCETRGDWRSFHTRACSRPPLPITRTFIAGDDKVRGTCGRCQTLESRFQIVDFRF